MNPASSSAAAPDAAQAGPWGLVDAVFVVSPAGFVEQACARAAALARDPALPALLRLKQQRRQDDEALKPLAAYREEELARMRRSFYGFDPSYHIARSNFVRRVAPSWTPRHLAIHRHALQTAAPSGIAELDEDQ